MVTLTYPRRLGISALALAAQNGRHEQFPSAEEMISESERMPPKDKMNKQEGKNANSSLH